MCAEMSVKNTNETAVERENIQENRPGTDQPDAILPSFLLNHNAYATKKTLAHGMLDLALLTANAAQLKYIISTWEHHEFNSLLLVLVVTSIILQVVQAIVCIILGLIFDINQVDHHKSAEIINNVSLAISVLVVTLNIVISVFGSMKS